MLIKLKAELPGYLALPHSGTHPRDSKSTHYKETYSTMSTTTLFAIAKPRLGVQQQMNKQNTSKHIIKNISATKKNETMTSVRQAELGINVSSETTAIQKSQHHLFVFRWGIYIYL